MPAMNVLAAGLKKNGDTTNPEPELIRMAGASSSLTRHSSNAAPERPRSRGAL
jgi:hypothetical protein